jgi:hypothetical protein
VAAGFTMNAPFRRASRVADHRLWNLEGSAMQESSDTPPRSLERLTELSQREAGHDYP